MATVTAEIDIHATPEQILDVLADLTHYPEWSSVHKNATVDSTHPDGRPKRATMGVAAVGMTDQQVLDYAWTAHGVRWSLVKSGQQKDQHGSYAITAGHGVSHVRYELQIDPAIPVPGLIVKQIMKKAVTAATEGLRKRVETAG